MEQNEFLKRHEKQMIGKVKITINYKKELYMFLAYNKLILIYETGLKARFYATNKNQRSHPIAYFLSFSNVIPKIYIKAAFIWYITPQGGEFWYDVHIKWLEHLEMILHRN